MIHKTHASKLSEGGPASFRAIVACSWLALGAYENGENSIELASKRLSNTCASGKSAILHELLSERLEDVLGFAYAQILAIAIARGSKEGG
jgi:hypothetical protein